ncbi:hypothetical protein OHB00_16035 [Streptomyces sp. NBC_00631]|uniref:hypothetical protein n=1 Tax=Streptomyces sp. NBC_00631 TaxID=2975793 RepID=UPI0030DEC440
MSGAGTGGAGSTGGVGSTGGGAVTGNVFHGGAAIQTGANSRMNVEFRTQERAPLDIAADDLARAVAEQWNEEAGLRRLLDPAPLPVRWRVTGRKVAGRVAGATTEAGRARFDPLPGLAATTGERLREGGGLTELHDVYGGLASGRVLLIGPATVGKTATAILLLLAALRYRAAQPDPGVRARIPVPVLLPLEDWNPAEERAVDWAAGQLSRRYTLFRDRDGRERARDLLAEGRISLVLDGLDEVEGRLRAAMVSALEPAPCRLVLVSRARAAERTARKARLGGAVALELQRVERADAVAYLLDAVPEPPPPAWRALAGRVREEPDSAVARALASPLVVSLVRDAYSPDGPVDELLDTTRFPRPVDIEDHLLDHAVTAAYTPRPGYRRPRYSPETAERTLRHIAVRLTEEGTRDLRWWHIPGWGNRRSRAIAVGCVVGPFYGLVGAFGLWQAPGPSFALLSVPFLTVMAGFIAGHRVWTLGDRQPLASAGWRDIFSPKSLGMGVAVFVLCGLGLEFFPVTGFPVPAWVCWLVALPSGYAAVLVTGPGHRIMAGSFLALGSGDRSEGLRKLLNPRPPSAGRSIGPREVWRHHIGLRLVLGLLVGPAVALFIGPLRALRFGFWPVAQNTLGAALWAALLSGPFANLAVATGLTALQLRITQGTPVRLVAFLEDARRRNLLRTVGPVYQFRHARLQERLARVSPAPEPPSAPPG